MAYDILEEVVDDYLQFLGYFTVHNVYFAPDPAHSTYEDKYDRQPSDIDIIGYHPNPSAGQERVVVVSCKSWQDGFSPQTLLTKIQNEKKFKGKGNQFRELWQEKWNEALRRTVKERTGEDNFGYRVAVTKLIGPVRGDAWMDNPRIGANMKGCSIEFLELETMWSDLVAKLSRFAAPSQIGRLAQLLRAAGLTDDHAVAEPKPPMPNSPAAIIAKAESDDEGDT